MHQPGYPEITLTQFDECRHRDDVGAYDRDAERRRDRDEPRGIADEEPAGRPQEHVHPIALDVRMRIVDAPFHRREGFSEGVSDADAPTACADDLTDGRDKVRDGAVPEGLGGEAAP